MAIVTFLMLFPLQLMFVPNDSAGYAEMIRSGTDLDGLVWGGKSAVAMFYDLVSAVMPIKLFTNCILLWMLYTIFREILEPGVLLLGLFLIAPIAPYFGYVTKEALLIGVALAAIACDHWSRSASKTLLFSGLFMFSVIVRPYYLPFLAWSAIWVRVASRYKTMVVLGVIAIVFGLLSSDFFIVFLYETKRAMWERLRFYSSVNSLLPLDFVTFPSVWDLFHIFVQNLTGLLTPFVRTSATKGAFALVHLASFISLLVISRKSVDQLIWIFVGSVFAFMTFLVPDSGTFVRHTGALAALLLINWNLTARRRRIGWRRHEASTCAS